MTAKRGYTLAPHLLEKIRTKIALQLHAPTGETTLQILTLRPQAAGGYHLLVLAIAPRLNHAATFTVFYQHDSAHRTETLRITRQEN